MLPSKAMRKRLSESLSAPWASVRASIAAIVLLGHYHYSIDVFAAFFITYGIYHIALSLFPRAYALFESDVPDDFE